MIPVDPIPALPALPDPAHLLDPALAVRMILGLVNELLTGLRSISDQVLERYFLWTGNLSGGEGCMQVHVGSGGLVFQTDAPCRFIDNRVLRGLYGLCSAMANAALGGVVVYAMLRSIWERGYQSRYDLRAMLPRLLLVAALVNFGLPLMQGAIDLNNAAVHAFWTFDLGLAIDQPANLWTALVMLPDGNLLVGLLALVTALMFLVLAAASVARNLLLVFLIGGAPLVFACMLLPETHTYVTAWRRLFLATVFTQAIQVLVLRTAFVLLLEDRSPFSAVHGLLALFLVLKVPGALHASSKIESKVVAWAKHAEHALEKTISTASHGRARAHPAAD
ncbi:MAG: hypothetical protein QOE92_147 [Chloroflexota bacterium]|jgi:hypothetical protein|nr:hypothetical protein [Chloroflexota bacterium]